jgi:hypothetical protein
LSYCRSNSRRRSASDTWRSELKKTGPVCVGPSSLCGTKVAPTVCLPPSLEPDRFHPRRGLCVLVRWSKSGNECPCPSARGAALLLGGGSVLSSTHPVLRDGKGCSVPRHVFVEPIPQTINFTMLLCPHCPHTALQKNRKKYLSIRCAVAEHGGCSAVEDVMAA